MSAPRKPVLQLYSLPFRLRIPGKDSIDGGGIKEVSYRVEGNLHFEDDLIVLEWAATRQVETVGFLGIKTEVDESPIATVEIPVDLLGQARVYRPWWGAFWGRWRLELRSRRLDAFDAIPGGRLGRVELRIHPRDHEHAEAVAAAINDAGVRRRLPER